MYECDYPNCLNRANHHARDLPKSKKPPKSVRWLCDVHYDNLEGSNPRIQGSEVADELAGWAAGEFKLETFKEVSFSIKPRSAFEAHDARADLAGFKTRTVWGFEIKSDYDHLLSWLNQRERYEQVFHYNYLVVSEAKTQLAWNMITKVHGDSWMLQKWGLITYSGGFGSLAFKLNFRANRCEPNAQTWGYSLNLASSRKFLETCDWYKVSPNWVRAAAERALGGLGPMASLQAFRATVQQREAAKRDRHFDNTN